MHLIYIFERSCQYVIVLLWSFWFYLAFGVNIPTIWVRFIFSFWKKSMSSTIYLFTGENTILKKEDLYPLFMISRLCMSLKAIIMPDRCFNFWSKIAKIVDNQNIFSNVLSWIEFYLNPSKSLLDNVLRVDYLQSSYRKYLLSIKRNYDLKSLNL